MCYNPIFCCKTFVTVVIFRGNGASVARIVPYAALHYMAYEQYRRWIAYSFPEIGGGPILDLVAGSFSGGTAVLFTYPLDLVRTKLAYQVISSKSVTKIRTLCTQVHTPPPLRAHAATRIYKLRF